MMLSLIHLYRQQQFRKLEHSIAQVSLSVTVEMHAQKKGVKNYLLMLLNLYFNIKRRVDLV
jgi:hypothetical protein